LRFGYLKTYHDTSIMIFHIEMAVTKLPDYLIYFLYFVIIVVLHLANKLCSVLYLTVLHYS